MVHEEATAGHHDLKRTLKLFIRKYYNGRESQLIEERIRRCEACVKANQSPKGIPIGVYPIPERPFQTWSTDILGPLPMTENNHRYIMVVRDFTTRYTVLKPLENKDAESIINVLRDTISHYGSPEILLSDNAAEYKSEALMRFFKFYNINKLEISPYHPCLLYTSPSPRDKRQSRMPSSA